MAHTPADTAAVPNSTAAGRCSRLRHADITCTARGLGAPALLEKLRAETREWQAAAARPVATAVAVAAGVELRIKDKALFAKPASALLHISAEARVAAS